MTTFDLDANRAKRATLDLELVARFGGHNIRFHPMPPVLPSKQALDRITAAEGDDLATTMAVIDWLTVVVHPESADTLAGVLLSTDDPISAYDLAELYLWLLGQYHERSKPTEEPTRGEPTLPPAADPRSQQRLEQVRKITARVGGTVKG